MEQDFLKNIKEKGNQLNVQPQVCQWKKLEGRLDSWQHSQRPKRRGFFQLNIFWLAASVVGILLIASFAVFVYPKKEKPLAMLSLSKVDTNKECWKKIHTDDCVFIQMMDNESIRLTMDSSIVLKKIDNNHFAALDKRGNIQLDLTHKDTLLLKVGDEAYQLVK